MSQEITVGAWSASQSYTYDAVNRLASAVEEPTSPSSLECPDEGSSWCEEFGYDGRGNQWVSAASFSPSPLTPTSSSWFGDDNRLERPGYPNDFDYDRHYEFDYPNDPVDKMLRLNFCHYYVWVVDLYYGKISLFLYDYDSY